LRSVIEDNRVTAFCIDQAPPADCHSTYVLSRPSLRERPWLLGSVCFPVVEKPLSQIADEPEPTLPCHRRSCLPARPTHPFLAIALRAAVRHPARLRRRVPSIQLCESDSMLLPSSDSHTLGRGRQAPAGAGKTTRGETGSVVSKIGVMSTRQGNFSKDRAFSSAVIICLIIGQDGEDSADGMNRPSNWSTGTREGRQ